MTHKMKIFNTGSNVELETQVNKFLSKKTITSVSQHLVVLPRPQDNGQQYILSMIYAEDKEDDNA